MSHLPTHGTAGYHGAPGSKDPDAGAPGLSKYQKMIIYFLAMDILT
jgi:hypothetical protein